MVEEKADFSAVLEVLAKHEVDFIVVGGYSAVLLGAPVATFDVDIVHSRTQENLTRLVAALDELSAHYRDHIPRRIAPSGDGLSKMGHHLLATKFGPLDVLGAIGHEEDYADLFGHTESVEIFEGVSVDILDLATLIQVKEKTARPKDNYMLEILREMQNLDD